MLLLTKAYTVTFDIRLWNSPKNCNTFKALYYFSYVTKKDKIRYRFTRAQLTFTYSKPTLERRVKYIQS